MDSTTAQTLFFLNILQALPTTARMSSHLGIIQSWIALHNLNYLKQCALFHAVQSNKTQKNFEQILPPPHLLNDRPDNKRAKNWNSDKFIPEKYSNTLVIRVLRV